MPVKIRVTNIDFTDEQFIDLILSFTKQPDLAIIVKEHHPKDHYHVYLDSDSFSVPTIRKRLSEVCSTKNNDSYSVSTHHTDWKGYQGYLLKHEDTTILHCYYNIDELREYYNKQVSKSKHSQKRTEYLAIYNFVSDQVPEMERTPRTVAKSILQFYLKEQKIFHKAHIAQILQTIWYQMNPLDEWRTHYTSTILGEAELTNNEDWELSRLREENSLLKKHLKDYLRRVDPE